MSVLNYVPPVLSCPMCLCFLRAFIFLRALQALTFYVPYVHSFLTCLHFLHALRALHVLIFLRALHIFIFLRDLCAFTFLSVSNFQRALCAFIFLNKNWNNPYQPQQTGVSKNKLEQTKNSLNELKQLRAILENQF